MIPDSDIRCIDGQTEVSGTYTTPKFYEVETRRESKLRDVYSRKGRRTVFSTTPGLISLRSESGVCRVSSRGRSTSMHARHTDDSDIESRHEASDSNSCVHVALEEHSALKDSPKQSLRDAENRGKNP